MARQERSAGIVLFRADRRVIGGRRFLLLDYGRHWDYPKGHLKKDEDDRAAALRELEEETGIKQAELVPGFAHPITYFFKDPQHGLVRKTVMFFLAQTRRRRIRLSDEHVGFAFLPYAQAMDRLTYPSAKDVLRAARDFLDSPPSHVGGQGIVNEPD